MSDASRYVVIVSRLDLSGETGLVFSVDEVVLGPFSHLDRAEHRARIVRRLAEKYDEHGDTLFVTVERLHPCRLSAADAMAYLYGAIS